MLTPPWLPPTPQAEEGQCQENKLGRHVVTIDDYQVQQLWETAGLPGPHCVQPVCSFCMLVAMRGVPVPS